MPVLTVGKSLESKEPKLLIENKLALGGHRFSLVVIDDRGLESAVDVLTVAVRKPLLQVQPGVRLTNRGQPR